MIKALASLAKGHIFKFQLRLIFFYFDVSKGTLSQYKTIQYFLLLITNNEKQNFFTAQTVDNPVTMLIVVVSIKTLSSRAS